MNSIKTGLFDITLLSDHFPHPLWFFVTFLLSSLPLPMMSFLNDHLHNSTYLQVQVYIMLLGKLTGVSFFVEGPKLWFKKKNILLPETWFIFFPFLPKYKYNCMKNITVWYVSKYEYVSNDSIVSHEVSKFIVEFSFLYNGVVAAKTRSLYQNLLWGILL